MKYKFLDLIKLISIISYQIYYFQTRQRLVGNQHV